VNRKDNLDLATNDRELAACFTNIPAITAIYSAMLAATLAHGALFWPMSCVTLKL
jgi:hypothetical protein